MTRRCACPATWSTGISFRYCAYSHNSVGFTEAEDRYGAERTVILSHGFWQRRFGGALNAIGRTLQLTNETYTVIGVLPPGFEYFEKADVYTPLGLVLAPDSAFAGRGNSAFDFYALARLKPGVTLAQADREMNAIGQQLAREYPKFNEGLGAQLSAFRT